MPFTDFGASGWSHSWGWNAYYETQGPEPVPSSDYDDDTYTTSITITFPDGHVNKYQIQRFGPRAGGSSADQRYGPPYTPDEIYGWSRVRGAGVHEYLDNMAPDGTEFWLHLADGGAVHFLGTLITPPDSQSYWSYLATEVFDPHGFKTELFYNPDDTLAQVKQEGGRWLTLTWGWSEGNAVARVITRVETGGFAGSHAVDYTYAVTGYAFTLRSVVYPEGPPATYIYENALLKEAYDPRFAGAMVRIRYKYRMERCHLSPDEDEARFDDIYAQPEAIEEEQSPSNDLSGNPIYVSRFAIDCWGGTRTEWNGFGEWRKFNYGKSVTWSGSGARGNELAQIKDFSATGGDDVPKQRQSYRNGHPYQRWDGRDLVTQFDYNDDNGELSEVRHLNDNNTRRLYNYTNPEGSAERDPAFIHNFHACWLFSQTDERELKTISRRDGRRRIVNIIYPAGSGSEHFEYNAMNQVTRHTLPSGAVETYEYDPTTHRLMRTHNSVDGWDARKEYNYANPVHPEHPDLVYTMTDGRARAAGAPYTVRMEYNLRNQVTEVHYPPTPGGRPDPHIGYGYDADGNCNSITNEEDQTSTYTYDTYRRCTSHTEPLNAPDWTGNVETLVPSRTWFWVYDRAGPTGQSISSYAHTSKNWRLQIEPPYDGAGNRRAKVHHYDMNDRLVFEYDSLIQPPAGDWIYPDDAALHSYTYDENGQKKTYTDPEGRLTTYDYDLRNRLWKTNETVNTIPRTTETLYDTTGNKTLMTFPDTRTQQWLDYDPFGQAWTFIDERNNPTNLIYIWGSMKKLYTVTTHRAKDGGGMEDQPTTFSYDLMGRPTQVLFPDGTDEFSTYEFGQLKTWKTRRHQTKTILYDARGRELSHSWNDGVTSAIARSWDDANRLTSITNIFSSIDYAYDSAGQVIWEGNEIAGSGGRTQTNYYRYPDGNVAHLYYPGGTYLRKDYTTRGQLAAVGWDDEENNWWMRLALYTYMPDGKVDKVDYGSGTTSDRSYNGRGFIDSIVHRFTAIGVAFASHNYTRDTRDRITTFQKQTGFGDRFLYDDEGQLTDAWYNALDPAGAASGWTRRDHFDYDALGNRQGSNNNVASRSAGTTPVAFSRRDNGLNQYSSWSPSIIYHDDNYPGWSAPGNGVMMAEGWITASYNALNQPVAIWSPTYAGTSNFAWFGFDPLGRCVKRWVGPFGGVYSNPATYLHYDGWNLLQEGTNAWGPSRVYAHGNRVDEMVWSYNPSTGQQAFHHYDARGHCTFLTGSTANILEQYEYDAFGQPYFFNSTSQPINFSTVGNRFLFTGREWLSDLKLYDFRNRMYQPELGRFLQPDPKHFAAGDYNLYRYCHNDPINKSDPTGLADNIFVQIADGMAYMGRAIIDAFSTLGNQAVADVGDNPGQYAIAAATMGRGPKMQGPSAPLRGLGNPFKGKTPAEAAKMMERKGFERRGPDPEKGKGGYVNPKNDRSYHIDPKNRHNEPPHVDVNRPKDYDGPLEKKKLPLKEN